MKRKIYSNNLRLTGLARLQSNKANFMKMVVLLLSVFMINTSNAQVGEALHFDGVNDRVDLPITLSGSYTKQVWINADAAALSGFPNILSGSGTSLHIANGVVTAGHSGSFNQAVDTTGVLLANTWYHLAVTFDDVTDSIKLYKNGVRVSPLAIAPNYTEPFMRIGSFGAGFFFTGHVDEVRFWNRALTEAEIAATMNCLLPGDEPFLLAYYNFNEGLANGNNPGETVLPDVQDECTPDNGTLVNFALTGNTSNWVAPGAGVTGNCPGAYENINVTGNSVCIDNGDATPSLLDHTNFGDFGYSPLVRTFTIENTGSATLNISGATITGVDAADFTITSAPAATVAPGGSTTITISFNPTSPLVLTARNATVTINNSDTDEAAYTFAITAFNRGPGETLHFDGINDTVYLPVRISGSYTKEAWINTAALTAFPNIITGDSTALFLNNGTLAAGHSPGFNQVIDTSTALPPLPANTWVHIAVTYDAATTTMTLYRDGIRVGVNTTTPPRTDSLILGAFAGANFYSGLMDEVRIWDIARDSLSIASNRSCGLTGDEFFLRAYYKFNQGAAGGNNPTETMLRDSADKCFPLDGTLHNFALSGAVSNWVAPGITLSGTCAGSFENIAIFGLGNCIAIGDTIPSLIDGTDFGVVPTGTPFNQTFTITNTGNTDLNITGPILITGLDAALFTVISAPTSPIAPGASTTFTIQFQSAVPGIFTADVTATNSDLDEASYLFTIIVEAEIVLPVTLLSFDGIMKGSAVQLSWKTSFEQNNKGFEVLRSNNAQTNWESIGYVAGTNRSTGSSYGLNDYAPLKGINVYKLRQVDLDNRFTYSSIVVVNNASNSSVVSVYPNPFQEKFNLIFNDPALLHSVAKISSVTGNTVAVIKLANYRQEIDLSKVAPGMYFVSLANGEVIRLMKQ